MKKTENRLIELLPARDRKRMLGLCEPVVLELSEILCEPHDLAEYAYFPVDSFISLLTLTQGSPPIEVGMIGREGMLGIQISLGVPDALFRGLVQGAGSAWRIPTAVFREELLVNTALKQQLNRYVSAQMIQLGRAAGCLRFHQIGPRLARWLLMTQDRAHADQFFVTHEFLSHMLGVRRVGVTSAAGALQDIGLIKYHRGALTVLDRSGLEAAACGCYAADQKAYSEAVY